MRVTGIREFRNKAPELASGDEIVFITKHGKLTGILVPLAEPGELPSSSGSNCWEGSEQPSRSI